MRVKPDQGTERIIMKHKMWIYIHCIIMFSFIFPNGNQFEFTGSSGTHSTISLQSSTVFRDVVDGYTRITKEGNGHTTDIGMPELPTYTTF